jgi:zinc/manganese transport system ATP-binding protein
MKTATLKTHPLIKAKNLAAGYNDIPIWQKASFEVSAGDFIGLLGPNGAGKTTLFKLILGLSQPLGGEIVVFGNPATRGNERIGYVPQRRNIDDESRLAALEYVRMGINGTKWGFSLPAQAANERRKAMEALELVDAVYLASKPLSKLSGGEAQRVLLAQALASKPDLLLLDEPLANLDIRRGSELIKLINDIVKRQNIAVMLIAHDINPLLHVINRIVYIANEKVVSGAPSDIITTKTLSRLYGAPVEVLHDSKGRLAVIGIEEAIHHDK